YPSSAEEARELGLPVSTEIPDRVLEPMALYPQPVHTQPGGVEYLPVPWQKEPTPLLLYMIMSESRRARWISNGAETRGRRRPTAMAPLDRLSEVRTCRRPGPDDIAFGHNRRGHLETGDQDPVQSGSIGHVRPDRLGGIPKRIRHGLHGDYRARVQANARA